MIKKILSNGNVKNLIDDFEKSNLVGKFLILLFDFTCLFFWYFQNLTIWWNFENFSNWLIETFPDHVNIDNLGTIIILISIKILIPLLIDIVILYIIFNINKTTFIFFFDFVVLILLLIFKRKHNKFYIIALITYILVLVIVFVTIKIYIIEHPSYTFKKNDAYLKKFFGNISDMTNTMNFASLNTTNNHTTTNNTENNYYHNIMIFFFNQENHDFNILSYFVILVYLFFHVTIISKNDVNNVVTPLLILYFVFSLISALLTIHFTTLAQSFVLLLLFGSYKCFFTALSALITVVIYMSIYIYVSDEHKKQKTDQISSTNISNTKNNNNDNNDNKNNITTNNKNNNNNHTNKFTPIVKIEDDIDNIIKDNGIEIHVVNTNIDENDNVIYNNDIIDENINEFIRFLK